MWSQLQSYYKCNCTDFVKRGGKYGLGTTHMCIFHIVKKALNILNIIISIDL